jgi:tripartite-type tricarboxylate transporter receptor subunit TctC
MLKNIPDTRDWKILDQLQQDARISNVDLPRAVNLSPAPCLARVRRLEGCAVISRYVTLRVPKFMQRTIAMTSFVHTVAIMLLALISFDGYAQTAWPERTIRIITPYPPAGTSDILSRVLGQKLTETWGRQVVVENRPGASGMIAAEAVAKSTPDGYTLLLGYVLELAINPSLVPKMSYDPQRDFAPIAHAGTVPLLLVAHPSLPVKTLRELIALARARPGEITYASPGHGSPAHLASEILKRIAKVDMLHVPYKGAIFAFPDLVSGRVSMYFLGMPAAMPMVHAGKLRAIAVSTAQRSRAAPQVPTVSESGLPGFDIPTWFALVAPAGTSPAIIAKLHAETVRVFNLPEVERLLAEQGAEPSSMTPEQLAKFMRAETEKFAKTIKEAGIKIQ